MILKPPGSAQKTAEYGLAGLLYKRGLGTCSLDEQILHNVRKQGAPSVARQNCPALPCASLHSSQQVSRSVLQPGQREIRALLKKTKCTGCHSCWVREKKAVMKLRPAVAKPETDLLPPAQQISSISCTVTHCPQMGRAQARGQGTGSWSGHFAVCGTIRPFRSRRHLTLQVSTEERHPGPRQERCLTPNIAVRRLDPRVH